MLILFKELSQEIMTNFCAIGMRSFAIKYLFMQLTWRRWICQENTGFRIIKAENLESGTEFRIMSFTGKRSR